MNLDMSPERDPQAVHYWLGFHEIQVQKALRRLVSEGQTVYDVGAYVGFFSLILGRLVGSTGRVFAFDPVRKNCRRIELHAAMNGMPWIVALPMAVTDGSGVVGWEPGERSDWGRIVGHSWQSLVEATSLDDFVFVKGYPVPALIKIDVEGAEGSVVRGASQVLRDYRPAIVCEVHGAAAGETIRSELVAAGYRLCSLSFDPIDVPPGVGHVVGLPPTRLGNEFA